MSKPIIPLSPPCFQGNERAYVTECIDTAWVSSAGRFVDRFESELAAYIGASDAVACVNGTAALHVSLMLLGVQPDDEVIVPTLTFIAPVNAVRYVGAHPVFMDCDAFLNLDVEKVAQFCAEECEQTPRGLVNRRTQRRIAALVVVHVFGHPAAMQPLMELAARYHLPIIEDATESLGSVYTNWDGARRSTGTIGAFGCFSFNGNKIITSGGGGMLVAQDAAAVQRARYLTTQAKDDAFFFRHDAVGYNYRLTNLQAAVGVAQLEQLSEFVRIKRANFFKYEEGLRGIAGIRCIGEPAYAESNFWHYAVIAEDHQGVPVRDGLLEHLRAEQIEARPVWRLNHRQVPYQQSQAYHIERAPWFEARVLNVPCGVGLCDDDIQRVIQAIRSFYGAD